MRDYEIVIMIFYNKDIYINDIISYYSKIINSNGKIYKLEKLGLKYLSYKIKNNNRAYYIVINIKVNVNTINLIKNDLELNNNVLRFLIIRKKFIK